MAGMLAKLCENSRRAVREGIYDTGADGERSGTGMEEALRRARGGGHHIRGQVRLAIPGHNP